MEESICHYSGLRSVSSYDLHFDKKELSLWERFQQQLKEPWPITDFDQFKDWWSKQPINKKNEKDASN